MKQVIQNFKTGELKVDEVPTPTLKGSGVLVQNYYSVISAGTERSTVEVGQSSLIGKAKQKPEQVKQVIETVKKEGFASTYKKVQNKLSEPKALGYSSAGKVIAVSEDVKNFKIGDMVACGGQDYASHAEVVFIPKNLACKIPRNVNPKDAAFSTMGAIALQGVRLCKTEIGHKVAVLGMGLLGNLAVQMLVASGCEVLAIDISESSLKDIKKYGATLTANSSIEDVGKAAENFTNGQGLDSVLITAGTSSNAPIELSGDICRKKGRVVVTGTVKMDIPRNTYFKKEIEVVISSSYGPGRYDPNYEEMGQDYPYSYVRFTENRNIETFLDLLKNERVNIASLITHEFAIEKASDAYDLVLGKKNEAYKAIILSYPQVELAKKHQTHIMSELTKTNKIAVGFIGAGSYAQSYLLPAVMEMETTRMTTVCTGNGINAKNIASKFNFSSCTTDYTEVTESENVDVVFIATRHDTHAELTKKAMLNGKHIFVEKPLALTRFELNDIKETYFNLEKKVHLMVGFNRRYSSLSIALKKKFDSINEPLIVNYRINAGFIPKDHWLQNPTVGGGRVIGEVCHFIDYAKFIIASKIQTVYAKTISSNNKAITNEDNIVITLSFENGSIAVITYLSNGDKSVSKERIEVTGGGVYGIIEDFQILNLVEKGKTRRVKEIDKGQKKCAKLFVEQIKKENPLISPDDLFEVTECAFDVLSSLKNNEIRS